MSEHQWEIDSADDDSYHTVITHRCSRCKVERQITTLKDAHGFANGTSSTIYRAPDWNWLVSDEPPCKWEIAGPLAPEKDRVGKAQPFSPLYLGIEAESLEVARCWVDGPDGTRRRVRVYVNAVAALDQALATLPYNNTTYTSGGIRMIWSEVEG